MPSYVILMKLNDKMSGDIKKLPERMDEIGEAWEALTGSPITTVLATFGDVDIVAVGAAEDDETAAHFALNLSDTGWARTTTMRAYAADEVAKIITIAPVQPMKAHNWR